MSDNDKHPDWLPLGWKVCFESGSFGLKYKYYLSPSNSIKCYSKPEVLRYLQMETKKPEDLIKENTSKKSASKVKTVRAVDERLPPGWIKEIKIRNYFGKIRTDSYYTDTVSGYCFRSFLGVLRYIESKLNDKDQLSAEAEGQRSIDKEEDKSVMELELPSGSKSLTMNNENMPEDNHVQQKEEEKACLSIEHSEKLQIVDTVESHASRMMENKLVTNEAYSNETVDKDQGSKSGSEGSGVKSIDIPETYDSEGPKRENVKRPNKRKMGTSNIPCRTSKRFALPRAVSSLEAKTANISGNAGVKASNERLLENPSINKQKDLVTVSHGNLSRVEEEKYVDCKKDEEKQELDTSLKDILMDPCIEFAVKTLTGSIEDLRKASSSVLPSGDILFDPCFEFDVNSGMPSVNSSSKNKVVGTGHHQGIQG